jgi:hypothetical protein
MWILAVVTTCAVAYGQSGNLTPQAAYCMYGTKWIRVAASLGTAAPESYPQIALYGSDGSKWYPLACDSSGHLISAGGGVTAVSIATANGVSGSSSGGTTPALTIVLGAITPTSVNGMFLTATANGGYFVDSYAPSVTATGDTAFGQYALASEGSAGNYNTAIGNGALASSSSGTNNVAVGYSSLNASGSAKFNTAIGVNSMANYAPGNYNVAIGYAALLNDEAADNTGVGTLSATSTTTGAYNTALGYDSMPNNDTGSYNVCLGALCGSPPSGGFTEYTHSIYIGYNTENLTAADTNAIVIGDQAQSAGSNTTVLGNTSTTLTYLGGVTMPLVVYSNAGTQLAACASTIVGGEAVVSDATALTPGTAYSVSAGAGTDTVRVQCALVGSTYAWQTM